MAQEDQSNHSAGSCGVFYLNHCMCECECVCVYVCVGGGKSKTEIQQWVMLHHHLQQKWSGYYGNLFISTS